MSTSIMIHHVQSVSANGFDKTNANALTLKIGCSDTYFTLTLFDLPTSAAERLSDALRDDRPALTEEEIRADERRKIAGKLGL